MGHPEAAPASRPNSQADIVDSQEASVDVKNARTKGGGTHHEHFEDSGRKTLTSEEPPPKLSEYAGVGIGVCTGVGFPGFPYPTHRIHLNFPIKLY